MKKTLVFICLAAFAIACGSAEGKKQTAKASSTADGTKIYKTYCVACHGLYGDMGVNGALDLTKSILTLEERITVIADGRNAMTPFKNLLNEEKIKAVAAYTLKLKKK